MRYSAHRVAPGPKARRPVNVSAPVTALARQGAAHPALTLTVRERVGVLDRERMATSATATFLKGGLLPSLLARVPEIVVHRSEKQVVGSHARGVVALVADDHSTGNGPVFEREGVAVGTDGLPGREAELSVPCLGNKTLPLPATVTLEHLAPEPLRRIGTHVLSRHTTNLTHNSTVGQCHVWEEVGAA